MKILASRKKKVWFTYLENLYTQLFTQECTLFTTAILFILKNSQAIATIPYSLGCIGHALACIYVSVPQDQTVFTIKNYIESRSICKL